MTYRARPRQLRPMAAAEREPQGGPREPLAWTKDKVFVAGLIDPHVSPSCTSHLGGALGPPLNSSSRSWGGGPAGRTHCVLVRQ